MNLPIYLDYNATTPVDPRVAEAVTLVLREQFGNPSSDHVYGIHARETVAWSRQQVAELLEAEAAEIIFTGSASEANNLAILGVAGTSAPRRKHLIVSSVEHPSVRAPAEALRARGWEVTFLPVDETGRVRIESLVGAIREETALISVMHANNEVGTIQPIAEISAVARAHGLPLHVDASQSVGKIPVSVRELGADLLTLAGHKFYAPKGIGVLYVRRGVELAPLLHGAFQEGGRRTGTENVAFIAGLGKAARLARQRQAMEESRLRYKRDTLHRILLDAIPELQLNGHPRKRLPNTLHVSFPEVAGRELLAHAAGEVAASVGSACHAHDDRPSGVLAAMGLTAGRAAGAVRLSVGVPTTEAEIERAARALIGAWQVVRRRKAG